MDPALAREAAITRQRIETPKEGAATTRIARCKSGGNAGDDDNNDDDGDDDEVANKSGLSDDTQVQWRFVTKRAKQVQR